MSRIIPFKRYFFFKQKLCLTSFLVSVACLSTAQATRDEFINATPRQRPSGWENIDLNEQHFIASPIQPPLPINAQTTATQRPFSLKAVRYDGIKLTPTPHAGATRYSGDIRGTRVSFEITFRINDATHQPEVQEIRDYESSDRGRTPLPLTNTALAHYLKIFKPTTPDLSSLNSVFAMLRRCRADSQISIEGMVSDREIEMDFEQEYSSPLQLSEVLYVKKDRTLGVFGKINLPGRALYFELIRAWNLDERKDLQLLPGEFFYDGSNIYTKISTRTWINNWTYGTDFRLLPGDKEKLIVMTLHHHPELQNWESINPQPTGQVTATPVGRYRPNNRYEPCGRPTRQRGAAIYSNGRETHLFLAHRYVHSWHSVAQPIISYDVETFSNTGIPLIFDALHSSPYIWPEGIYILSDARPSKQIWTRWYSPHGVESYEIVPVPGSGHISITPEKPVEMRVDDYLTTLSHFSVLTARNLADPAPLGNVQPDILTLRRNTGSEVALDTLTKFINQSSFSRLKVLTLKVPLQTLAWGDAGKNADIIVSNFAKALAQLPSLHILNVTLPPLSSYVRDGAEGGAIGGASVGGLLLTGVGIAAAWGTGGLSILSTAVVGYFMGAAGGGAAGAAVGAAAGAGKEVITLGESYPQHLIFGRELGKSLSLRQIVFFDASHPEELERAVNAGRAFTNRSRNLNLPNIRVEFE